MNTWLERQQEAHKACAAVALHYGVSMAELVGRARTKQLCEARQSAMWLCKVRIGMSYVETARYFERDHTTIMHGVRAHQRRLDAHAARVAS